jgi:hypothetical protein
MCCYPQQNGGSSKNHHIFTETSQYHGLQNAVVLTRPQGKAAARTANKCLNATWISFFLKILKAGSESK